MKQTAVEWLVDELNNIKAWTKNGIILSKADILIGQAKEMEKQQQGYSEEEVIEVLQKYRFDLSSNKTPNLGDTAKQWFNQCELKKK